MPDNLADLSYASLLRRRERLKRAGLDTTEIDQEIERREFKRQNPLLKDPREAASISNIESMVEQRNWQRDLGERKFTEQGRQFDAGLAERQRQFDVRHGLSREQFEHRKSVDAERSRYTKALTDLAVLRRQQEQGLAPDPQRSAYQAEQANRRLEQSRRALLTRASQLDMRIDQFLRAQLDAQEQVTAYGDASEQDSPYRRDAVNRLAAISDRLHELRQQRLEIDQELQTIDRGLAEARGQTAPAPTSQPATMPAGELAPRPPGIPTTLPAATMTTTTTTAPANGVRMAPMAPDSPPLVPPGAAPGSAPAGPTSSAGGFTAEQIARLQEIRHLSPTADRTLRQLGL